MKKVNWWIDNKTTRQGALANGLHGLNPRNTGTASLADAPTGLSARDRTSFCGQVVIAANLTSESQRQACCGPFYPLGQERSWQRAETLGFTLV